MKIHRFNFEGKEMVQIYINKEENESKEIKTKIQKLKEQKLNVALFISGKSNTIKTIKEMLNYEKSKNIN